MTANLTLRLYGADVLIMECKGSDTIDQNENRPKDNVKSVKIC